MELQYFKCWNRYEKVIARLTDEQAGQLFRALLGYSATGKAPELDSATGIAFDAIASEIEVARNSYKQVVERNQRNGRKGGRPKKDETTNNLKNPDGFLENPKNPNGFSKTHPLRKGQGQGQGQGKEKAAAVAAATRVPARELAPAGAPPLPPAPLSDADLPSAEQPAGMEEAAVPGGDAVPREANEKSRAHRPGHVPGYRPPASGSPEEFFEQGGFGKANPTVTAMLNKYRERGCADDLLIKAMQEALDNGVPKWAYVKPVLERCLAAGIHDAAGFAASKRPHASRNALVDRTAPSGNNFLPHGTRRPLRIKREEGPG